MYIILNIAVRLYTDDQNVWWICLFVICEGIRIQNLQPGQIIMDIDFRWGGDPSIILAVDAVVASLPIQVFKFWIFATWFFFLGRKFWYSCRTTCSSRIFRFILSYVLYFNYRKRFLAYLLLLWLSLLMQVSTNQYLLLPPFILFGKEWWLWASL